MLFAARKLALAFAAAAAFIGLTGCVHHDWLESFGYDNLPEGYHWVAIKNKGTADIVYYGKDPQTGDTLYVGPDSIFYHYHHPGPITPRDLSNVWDPHDAPSPSAS